MFLQLLRTITTVTTYKYYLFTISLQLVASAFHLVFTSLLRITLATLQKSCQRSGESRFDGSEKDRYLLKFPKKQHKLVPNCKQGKLVCYFLNNAVKTWLYALKISENIEMEHVFQSKTFFHVTSNLYTSCISAFKFFSFNQQVKCLSKIDWEK